MRAEIINIGSLSPRAASLHNQLQRADTITARIDGNYLIKGWIDREAFSAVYGASNVGKTFGTMNMCFHVAANKDWHGSKVHGGPVIYVAAEGGLQINNRIEAIRREHPDLVANADFHLLPTGLDLCGSEDALALIDAIQCLGTEIALLAIDTISRVMGTGDENTAKDVGQLIRNIDLIRKRLRCHVMLIHHSGKDATKGARGSSALRAAVDTEIELTRSGDVILAEAKKQRDMQSGRVFAYTLKDVEIGTDQDGDRVTSAVVVPTEAPTNTRKLSANDRILLEALQEFAADYGAPNPTGTGWPERGRYQIVDLEKFKKFAQGRYGAVNKRQAVLRALTSLQNSGCIGLNENFVWAIGGPYHV